jgi:hypothetical protein
LKPSKAQVSPRRLGKSRRRPSSGSTSKNIPTTVGAVTAVIVNPLVGSLVKAGGDALVAEFKSQFGS